MSDIQIVTYTDRHVRFCARLLQDEEVTWYHHASRRTEQTHAMAKHYHVKNAARRFYARKFFKNAIESEGTSFIFGRLGQKFSTRMFHCPELNSFLNTPIEKLKGRFVSMDESLLFHRDDLDYTFYPHADTFLTKSLAEHKYYQDNCPGLDIRFVGQAELDNTRPLDNKGTGVGILLAAVSTKKRKDVSQLREEFTQWVVDNNYSGPVYFKDHINSTGKFRELGQLATRCREMGLNPIVVKKTKSLVDVANKVSHAFVHETINSHFMLRRFGIESYFYSNGIPAIKNQFIIRSGMPEDNYFAYRDGHMTKEKFDKWMSNQFMLDGRCSQRMIAALKEEKK